MYVRRPPRTNLDGLTQNRSYIQEHVPGAQCPVSIGTKSRQFAATEIDKMLKQVVIEPATAEWGSLIVFTSEKDAPSVYVCTTGT